MELLSMLPENILDKHYRIIPESLNSLLGYELYGRIISDTVNFQDELLPITIIMCCHPSVFEDMYDSVKLDTTSLAVKVSKFIIKILLWRNIDRGNKQNDRKRQIYSHSPRRKNRCGKNSNWQNVPRLSTERRKTSSNGMLVISIPKLPISK
jgi:hypothetical protein